ncbi:hypothetical protein, partial [Peterkaempfera griseoplana]|uniref:hypothetical protein n=1 Tax=Peterkaempfera griseoplana TaxID=66896 RepID=UPI000B05154B
TTNPDGSTTLHLKRCCNGCGEQLGDVIDRDIDSRGNLTDVRGECPRCAAVVELEAAGCQTWMLTRRNIDRVDAAVDRDGIFAKGYWQDVDGKNTVVGLRIGQYPDHVVAYFGDWVIRHPDGRWTTLRPATPDAPEAPAAAPGQEA